MHHLRYAPETWRPEALERLGSARLGRYRNDVVNTRLGPRLPQGPVRISSLMMSDRRGTNTARTPHGRSTLHPQAGSSVLYTPRVQYEANDSENGPRIHFLMKNSKNGNKNNKKKLYQCVYYYCDVYVCVTEIIARGHCPLKTNKSHALPSRPRSATSRSASPAHFGWPTHVAQSGAALLLAEDRAFKLNSSTNRNDFFQSYVSGVPEEPHQHPTI